LTRREWIFPKTSTPRGRALVLRAFGKLIFRYTRTRVYFEYQGDGDYYPYRVLASDAETVAILKMSPEGNEIVHIHFTGSNLYWISAGRNREFFRKIED